MGDYSDAYNVKLTINLRTGINDDVPQEDVVLKNNAPCMSCITKINSILIDIAKDLDIIIAMYNLLEYSDNYSMTSGRL